MAAEQQQQSRRKEQQHGGGGGGEGEGLVERIRKHSPASSQIVGFVALLTVAGISVVLGGLTITGIVITLVLMTPVFLFFSPILVPAGILLFLTLGGVLATTIAGVAAVSAISWAYNYFHGRHPPGSQQIDYTRTKALEAVDQAKHKARDLGSQAREQIQSIAPTTASSTTTTGSSAPS